MSRPYSRLSRFLCFCGIALAILPCAAAPKAKEAPEAALAQRHLITALRLSKLASPELEASTRAEVARIDLSEGRFSEALAYAIEAGDGELAAKARLALYEDLLKAEPFVIRTATAQGGMIDYAPGGRQLILWDKGLGIQEPRTDGSSREIDSSLGLSWFEFSDDGRFIAYSRQILDPKTGFRDELRIERLDSGLEVCSAQDEGLRATNKGLPPSITLKKNKNRLLIVSTKGDLFWDFVLGDTRSLGFSSSKSLIFGARRSASRVYPGSLKSAQGRGELVLPQSAEGKFLVKREGGTLASGYIPQALGAPASLFYSKAWDAALSPDEERAAILAKGEGPFSDLDRMLLDDYMSLSPRARFSPGVFILPYPFLDRLERAAKLAAELGRTADMVPIAEGYIARKDYARALELARLAGIDEAACYEKIGETKLAAAGIEAAAEDFIKAGKGDRVLAAANERLARASDWEIGTRVDEAVTLYRKAGRDPSPLYHEAAKRSEAAGFDGPAADLYVKAGEQAEVERMLAPGSRIFAAADLATIRKNAEYIGGFAKLPMAMIESRIVAALEAGKRWAFLAEYYAEKGAMSEFARFALLAIDSGDRSQRLLDLICEKGDTGLMKAVAARLVTTNEIEAALVLMEAGGDAAGIAAIADESYEKGDYFYADQLYKNAGTKGAKATSAARIRLVWSELAVPLASAQNSFSESLIKRLYEGISLTWPIPAAKLTDPDYQKLKSFGDAILALPSRPSSAEARKCVSAISDTSEKELKAGYNAQAMADSREADWFTFAAKFLEAMGR